MVSVPVFLSQAFSVFTLHLFISVSAIPLKVRRVPDTSLPSLSTSHTSMKLTVLSILPFGYFVVSTPPLAETQNRPAMGVAYVFG